MMSKYAEYIFIKHDLLIKHSPWVRDYDARIEHQKIHKEIEKRFKRA